MCHLMHPSLSRVDFSGEYCMMHSRWAKKSSPKFFENLDEGWLSTNDVAEFLSVSQNAVRIMVCRGILPAHRLRGRLRFRKRDCLALFSKKGA